MPVTPPPEAERLLRRGRRLLRSWSTVWDERHLENRITIEFSQRLRRSLGRSLVERGLIRLHPCLQDPAHQALFDEVLGHEAAHFVAFQRHGRRCRPHGPEWRHLLSAIGITPRTGVPVTAFQPAVRRPTRRYEHRCPVCQLVWIARRRMRSWRCPDCTAGGMDGRLIITPMPGCGDE